MTSPINLNALCGALECERRHRELTWKGVAESAGVSRNLISRLRGNGGTITLESFAKLVMWLDVPAERFFVRKSPE